ncbi:hypothetical protein EF004_13835 [Salmonella enterica]|nr:hypothetical protein [Salmonella enterica subsp. enterica serovar Rubislaw]EAR0766490.1 hypothetical protein [Salmonella enterica]
MKKVFKMKKAGKSFREKVVLVGFRCEKMKEQERRAGHERSSPQSLCIIACISFFSTTVNKHRVVMLKTDNCATAMFCPECHYETDNGSHLEKVERRRLMSKVIVFTVIELARCGLITPAMIKE